jgi:hypothetical protein
MQAYAHIEDRAGSSTGIELWNGETGWPGTGWSAIQPLTLLLTQA